MSEWISFADKKPEIGQQVLSNCKHGVIEGLYDGEMFLDSVAILSQYYWRDMSWYATHWMPIPEPPKSHN